MKNFPIFLLLFAALFGWRTGAFAQCAICDQSCGSAGTLDAGCAASVCGYDPYCCNTQWDSICASEAGSDVACCACRAVPNCGGGGGCTAGPPFCDAVGVGAGFPTCTDCANAVCAYDSYCCNTFWDSICASEAGTDPNCTMCVSTATPDCNGVPGGPDVPGAPCNDANACTSPDTWDAGCNCIGTPLPDSDADGVCDLYDNCDFTFNPGQEDVDGDGVGNVCDNCMNTSNASQADADADGVGDVCDNCVNTANASQDDFDGDGSGDACDSCPLLAGQKGDPCDDVNAATILDYINDGCICAGTVYACPNNTVAMRFHTDGKGYETSFTITPSGGGPAACSGGSPGPAFASNSFFDVFCCLPNGSYNLTVFDALNDGMCCAFGTGGYKLVTGTGARIIDDSNDGLFGGSSSTSATPDFTVPISSVSMTAGSCDQLNLNPGSIVSVTPVAAVSAQWMVGMQTDDGYQYWMFDPDGTYSRRILVNHTAGAGPYGPTRCASLKLSSVVTNPVPLAKKLNIRVRSLVNGVYSEFGPACTMMVATCPTTQLTNNTLSHKHSCGITNVPLNGHKTIWADPISGANRYQFRFTRTGYSRNVASATNSLLLKIWATNPLQYGYTYNVVVHASFDNGATYCAYGPVCTITTSATPPPSGSGRALIDRTDNQAGLVIYPNPNPGDQVRLTLGRIPEGTTSVSVDVFDVYGKKVMGREIAVDGTEFNTVLGLNNELASGMYTVNVMVGERTYTDRLVIE